MIQNCGGRNDVLWRNTLKFITKTRVAFLTSTLAISFLPAMPSTAGATATSGVPLAAQIALSLVASSRNDGPLEVIPNAGSVVAGVWSSSDNAVQNAEVAQSWSFEALDNAGIVAIGVSLSTNGTESVNSWAPGKDAADLWIFSAGSAPLTSAPTAVVPGSMETITGALRSDPSVSLNPMAVHPADTIYECTSFQEQPYLTGGRIYYGATVVCNTDAFLSNQTSLTDNGAFIKTTSVVGQATVTASGTFACVAGIADNNTFTSYADTVVTFPPGTTPAGGQVGGASDPIHEPCKS